MTSTKRDNDEFLDLISDLVKDLASELDLHYEDSDMFALQPSIQLINRSKIMLESNEMDVPEAAQHLLRRFTRNFN